MNNRESKHEILAVCSGEAVKLEDVCDDVFSSGVLGKGFAIIPDNNEFFSPVDGVVSNAYDTGHAYTVSAKDGLEILIHIGIDTVELEGEYFNPAVKANVSVSRGDKIAYANTSNILSRGYDPITVVIITNPEMIDKFSISYGKVKAGDTVMSYTLKSST